MNHSSEDTIVIIDYGVGNLGSVANMLKKVGARKVIFSSDPYEIASANKVLLPGVGSFDHGMKRLNDLGISDALKTLVLRDDSLLMGICLGMQLLGMSSSESGFNSGFGLVDGLVEKFSLNGLKIPHVGYNQVNINKKGKLDVAIEK